MHVSGFGHALFAIAVAGLAILGLAYGDFAPLWEPLSVPLPAPASSVYGSGAILLAAGAGLLYTRTARVSTVIIGIFGSAWTLARARAAWLEPLAISSWYGISEALGPLVGVWTLDAVLCREHRASAVLVLNGDCARREARMLFGAACVVYGAAHFGYASYTASLVPAWLPEPRVLAYLTGAAHAAAGLGLLVGILPRLAATLEALMMSLFGALVWVPSFFARPTPDWATPPQVQWSETLVTFLLAASAWIVAASLRGAPWGVASAVPDDSATPAR